MATLLLKSIMVTSFVGLCLTLIITLLKPITKKLFGYNWHYYIWLTVLVVMILPVRFSIPNISFSNAPIKATAPLEVTETVQTDTLDNINIIEAETSVLNQSPITNFTLSDMLMDILTSIWLLGMLIILCVNIIGYLRLLYKIHTKSVKIACPEINKYTSKRIGVRVLKGLPSPFIMGIFRPILILPDIQLSPEQLDNILMHEVTHQRRNDILYKWFAILVKTLHWFNPCVYYVANQINTECEISCDMSVVKNMDKSQTTDYVNTIISLLLSNKSKSIPFTTGMTGNKNTLKKRFKTIKNGFTANKKTIVISVVFAVCIFAFTFLASGLLGGRWALAFDNTIIELDTDSRTGNNFNALVVGVDRQNRADSIMLLKMSDDGLEVVSIPRNTVVEGGNITYLLSQEYGDQKVIDAVRQTLSLPVTYYAKININLIKDLVDMTGGLTVDIPMDMKYDDPEQNLHIDLKKGEAQTLNGEQVCGLLQFRRSNDGTGYPKADLDRINTTQQVIRAFLTQNKLSEIAVRSKDFAELINKNVTTNYSIKNFIKDKKLLSGVNIKLYTLPGKAVVNDGILNYEIDSAQLTKAVSYPDAINTSDKNADNSNLQTSDKSLSASVYLQNSQSQSNSNADKYNPIATLKIPDTTISRQNNRFEFSSIAEAEQYLQSGGAVKTDNANFNPGTGYLKDDYSFEDNNSKKISSIACNSHGEVSMYFNANMDTLMRVSFSDGETKDEVNSAVILTGNERIYKFTGLDPSKHYDIEMTDLTEGDWEIKGEYIIF